MEEQQLPLKWEAYLGGSKGEAQTTPKEGHQAFVAPYETEPGPENLMEEAVEEENLFAKQGLVSLRQRYLELGTLRTAECV